MSKPMNTLHIVTLAMFTLASASACTPEMNDAIEGLGDFDAGANELDASVTRSPRGYAVTSGDYTVISIALLKPDGTLRTRELLHSGSATTGLVTGLSGDIAIPSNESDPGVLTILDRFRTDVITRLDLATGTVLGQVKTQAPNAETHDSYSSNPQDYLYIDDATAWVSRYEPNIDAPSDSPDRGTDLLRIDPTQFTRPGERIGFSEWNTQVERAIRGSDETESVTAYARPGAMVLRGGYAVVGIDRFSLAFDAVDQGAVALVDLERQRVVQMLELPGLQACSDLSAVPDDETRVAVACSGFVPRNQRAGSGLVMLVLENDALAIEHIWRASEDPESALTIYGVCALSATEVLVTAPGAVEESQPHDVLYRVDLESGEQHAVLEAGGAFVLGSAAFDPRTQLVLVPDATTDNEGRPSAGVHRFERRDDGEIEELGVTAIDDVLPSRQIRAFY